MSVIQFTKPEPRIFVCNCGCSTFCILENNTVRCAACDEISEGGSWFEEKADAPSYDDERKPTYDIQGNGSVEFARRRMSRIAAQDDVALIVVAVEGGRVSAWSPAETCAQAEWVLDRLDLAKAMIAEKAGGTK